jgi:hypothetical protein
VARSRDVAVRTTVVLLRLRLKLTETLRIGEHSSLAEEALLAAFEGAPSAAVPLPPGRAEELLALTPDANLPADVARVQIERILGESAALADWFHRLATERAESLAQAHERVRRVGRTAARGRVTVVPLLPVDLLGLYVFLPAG